MVRSRDSSELERVLSISSRETLKAPCFQNSHLARLPVRATECPSCVVQGVTGAGSREREPELLEQRSEVGCSLGMASIPKGAATPWRA